MRTVLSNSSNLQTIFTLERLATHQEQCLSNANSFTLTNITIVTEQHPNGTKQNLQAKLITHHYNKASSIIAPANHLHHLKYVKNVIMQVSNSSQIAKI